MPKNDRSAARDVTAIAPIVISVTAMVAIIAAATAHRRSLAELRQDVTEVGRQVSALRVGSAITEITDLNGILNNRSGKAKIIPMRHREMIRQDVKAK